MLKEAFDKVDKEKLGEMLKKIRIKEQVSKRIMEICNETRNIIKVGNRKSKEFWIKNEIKQRCPMSPTLFNINIMDLKEEMRKEQTRSVVIGRYDQYLTQMIW